MQDTHGTDWSARLARGRNGIRIRQRGGTRDKTKTKNQNLHVHFDDELHLDGELWREDFDRELVKNKNVKNKVLHVSLDDEEFDRELQKDAAVGADVLQNYAEADWWNWQGGSTLFFWRWPEGEQRHAARDGMKPWIKGRLPRFERRAKKPPSKKHHKILPKFVKFLKRKYVRFKRRVKSLSEYFDVPKGDDIQMVFNGTGCGLNEAAWAPNFWLPTSKSATRVLDFDYKTVNIDLGEIFELPPSGSLQSILRNRPRAIPR
jgi:hypothetical protein